jgi:hypothetical protein
MVFGTDVGDKYVHTIRESFWSTVYCGHGELELRTTNLAYHSFTMIKSIFTRMVTGVSKNRSAFIIRVKQSKWNEVDEGTVMLRNLGKYLAKDKA